MLDLESRYLAEWLFGIVIWGALAAIPIGLIELIGGLIQYSRSRIAHLGYYLTFSGLYLVGFALFSTDTLIINNEVIGILLVALPVALSWYLTWINYRVVPKHISPPTGMEDILDA